MSESVVFRINAADFATPLLDKVNKSALTMKQRWADVGAATKGTTAAFAGLANVMGATPFGQFSSGIGNSIGQLRLLGIQMQANTKTAALLKVGMGAVAFTIGFQIGSAIRDFVVNSKRMQEEFEASRAAAQKFTDLAVSMQQKRFQRESEKIGLMEEGDQEKARADQLKRVNNELDGVAASLKRGKAELHAFNTAWNRTTNQAEIDLMKDRVEQDTKRLDSLRAQRDEINWQLSAEKKQIDQMRTAKEERENAARQAKQDAEELARKTEEAERKRLQVATDHAKKQKDYLDDLKGQVIELGRGKIAADEFKARLAGISEETIAAGSEMRRLIEEANAKKEEAKAADKVGARPDLGAFESRLMSRGRGGDPQKQVADEVKKVAAEAKKQNELMQKANRLLEKVATNTAVAFEEIELQ